MAKIPFTGSTIPSKFIKNINGLKSKTTINIQNPPNIHSSVYFNSNFLFFSKKKIQTKYIKITNMEEKNRRESIIITPFSLPLL